jgi:hypothetical protein
MSIETDSTYTRRPKILKLNAFAIYSLLANQEQQQA